MTAILLYGGFHTVRIHPQGGFELLHGRRTARKTNAVKIATDVTQARLQVIASGNSAIWRTPYSEKRPAGTVRTAAWLSSPFVASSLANIQWQQFRYMADAIQ